MQKWEYTQLQVGRFTPEGKARLILRDHNQIYFDIGKDSMGIAEYLNKLGRDGWELVGIVNNEIFYLKRPKG